MRSLSTKRRLLLCGIASMCFALSSAAEALTINLSYEASVTGSPQSAEIQASVRRAADNISRNFTNPITVNIRVGWGTVAGYAMTGGLGSAAPSWGGYYTKGEMQSMLLATPLSTVDQQAYTNFPADAYFQGMERPFYLTWAQQKALGLRAANATGIDGYMGLGAVYPFTFDNTNGVAPGTYDLTAVAEQEMSHILGRLIATAPYASAFNLFDYVAPATPARSSFSGAFFSLDGGVTRVRNFHPTSLEDWYHDSLGYGDSFSTEVPAGIKRIITQADIDSLDVIGYSTIPMPTPTNGSCGSAHGVVTTTAPTSGLCNSGTATAVSGTGPWTWSCLGSSGGTTASCSAPVQLAAPSAPTNLVGTAVANGKRVQVSLSWNQSGAISYNTIYRSGGTGNMSLIAQTTTASTSYLDKSVKRGSTYNYLVKAANNGGESPASNTVTVTP